MKRRTGIWFICILLLVIMTVPVRAVEIAPQKKVAKDATLAERILAEEGPEALLKLVSPDISFDYYLQEGQANLRIWCPEGPAFATEDSGAAQTRYEVRMQETAGTGFTVEKILTYAVTPWKDAEMTDIRDQLSGSIYVEPYGTYSYITCCPADGNPRYEIIVVAGRDDNGHALEFYGVAERLNASSASGRVTVTGDKAHDTRNLRYEADFEVEVAEGVWWVPVRSLGESRYTNYEIAATVFDSPEIKQETCATLYEALQLFQIGDFRNGDDNIRLEENGLDWEHHKPGYEAVRTNTGCCATDSNWLNYILRDDYEQVGFLAYSQKDGSGHIMNYIFHEGYYYFIDLTHYWPDFIENAAPETGNMTDYSNSDFVAGNLHKASSPEAYISYVIESFNNPPARFFMYQAADCYPIADMPVNGKMTIIYPMNREITVFPGLDADELDVAFYPDPIQKASWADVPDADFRVEDRYLPETQEDETGEPLTAYQRGDILPLEDYGEQGYAIIDGTEYEVSNYQQRTQFGFEANVMMNGGNTEGYHDYVFRIYPHEEKIQGMDSLILGDLMLSFCQNYTEAQLVLCTREGNTLIVQEVYNDSGSRVIPVSIRKDEKGIWGECPEYWSLFHYRDEEGNIRYEFGRLRILLSR